MNKTIFFLVLFSAFAGAQNKRFTYEYAVIADSTNKADVHKELLVLDVSPTGSLFYSYDKFKSDSIQTIEINKQSNSKSEIINIKQDYKGKVFYTISKKYPTFKTFLHTGMGNDNYKIVDDRKPIWTISSDQQKIGEFQAQKAQANLYGRKWTAWFATELPIQDGPYKFQGLPGLIVKIEDETKTHSYELKGIANYIDTNKLSLDEERNYNKEILIDYPKYKKLFLEQRNDPAKSLRELMNRAGTNFKMFGPDGNEINPSDMIRQREVRAKEDRKKNNNPLELDLIE